MSRLALYIWRHFCERHIMTYEYSPQLKHNQSQALYGTILGGSSIVKPSQGKNCYLAMRDNDRAWLEYKINELKDYFKMDNNTIKKDKNTYRCYSIAYPIFNAYYNEFYANNKKFIGKETLERLNDVAWMIWFVDAGKKSKRKAYLRTHKFGEEGTKMIAEYFNSLDCDCDFKLTRERYEIVFTHKGSIEFLATFAHRLPNFMLSKFDI